MPHYTFPAGELTAEHKRQHVHDIELDVTLHETTDLHAGPEFLSGSIQVCGALELDCAPAENRLRPGMLATLRLGAPDGRFTRLTVLLTGLLRVAAPRRGSASTAGAFSSPPAPPPTQAASSAALATRHPHRR